MCLKGAGSHAMSFNATHKQTSVRVILRWHMNTGSPFYDQTTRKLKRTLVPVQTRGQERIFLLTHALTYHLPVIGVEGLINEREFFWSKFAMQANHLGKLLEGQSGEWEQGKLFLLASALTFLLSLSSTVLSIPFPSWNSFGR